jgi:hypothetical protein
MDPAGGTTAPNSTNLNADNSTSVKAPEGMDLSAINEAIAASADEAAKAPQQTFDVNDISLDNTPTTDAALEQQQAKDPNMSLANSGAAPSATAAPAATTAAESAAPAEPADKPAAPAASFVDGDIVDESPAEEKAESAPAAAPEPNYDDALNADPLASFDESNPSMPSDTAPAEGDAKKEDEKKDEKKSMAKKEIKIHIDFDKILHNNFAIIGIVVGIIVIVAVAIVIFTING